MVSLPRIKVGGHMLTVLIADDSPIGLHVMEAMLCDANFTIHRATNGQEALERAIALRPDLIVLDIMMPLMDGIEVTERIRAHAEIGRTPILMATALDDRDTRQRALSAGANDLITKPIKRAELLTIVARMVEGLVG